ncbi:MAG: hypothetical protein OER88_10250 [Planctomycetota bacterium]|nr:hypothetical protein [Planctomycetota bacterium]
MAARRKKKKKTTTRKKTTRRKTTRDVLCVGSKVKAYVKSQGMKCSGELVGGVSEQIHAMLDSAINRCTENRRSTVRPHDL